MEKIKRASLIFQIKSYCMLTKPGILFGNAITAMGGFALAARGQFDFWLFLAMLEGLVLIMASGCVFNNYIDRVSDKKMNRTKNRALAKEVISIRGALIFASSLALMGAFILAKYTNMITVTIALFGLFMYVVVYTLTKYITHHGTLIGSIAGAVPPVVGYTAMTNRFDLGALILFLMIALWQMPHFFAIAIYRMKEYAAASIPVLPIKKGVKQAKRQIVLYVIAFMAACSLLTVFNYTGVAFLAVIALLGLTWLWICFKGFSCKNDVKWARQVFAFSLVTVTALCAVIPFFVI